MRKALIATLLLSVACASGKYADINTEKTNKEFKGGAGQKTLVVVATPDRIGRENLEDQFAIEGVNNNVSLNPSYRVVPNIKDLTREALETLVKTNGYDRVLLVKTVPGSWKTGEHSYYGDYYSVVASGIMPNMYDYWGSTITTVYSPTDPPPSLVNFNKLSIETRLYDSADSNVIWSAITDVTQSRDRVDAPKAFVKTIVDRLHGLKLL
jgi:hypothetical protein